MSRSHSGAFVQLRESLPAAPKCASLFNHARYDRLKRLTAVSDTNYSRGFSYDVYGNMSVSSYSAAPSVSGLMPRTSQSPYNAANNRLLEANYGDVRGNITAIGAVNSIQYDGESRQIYTSDSGTGQAISYLYDGMGQRMERGIAGGATTFYVHDAFGNLAAEYNSAGVTPDCATCYLSYDELGNVRMVTDQNATIIARHDYLPFGEEIPGGQAGRTASFGFGNGGTITQKFTGQERDGGTATLDYFNARHFSAVTGSFTQPDPMNAGGDILNPQSWNAYAYVLGNPLALTDPSGMAGEVIGTIKIDPDFATSTNPYSDLLTFYATAILQLSGGSTCTNCGGNKGKSNPPPAKSGTAQRLACAAKFGNDHSIGALFGGGKVAMFLGGNTASSLLNIGLAVTGNGPAPDPTKLQLSGPALGIPVNDVLRLAGKQTIPQLSSVSGFVRGAALKTVFNAATGPASLTSIAQGGEIALQGGITASEYASGVAVAKFAFDIGTVGYGYFFSCGGGG